MNERLKELELIEKRLKELKKEFDDLSDEMYILSIEDKIGNQKRIEEIDYKMRKNHKKRFNLKTELDRQNGS
jgi:phosphopantetheine adenylyltransferase